MLHLSSLILAVALGQVPGETAWLSTIPAEADVVVRVSGAEPVQKDLIAMIKAMSPTLGQSAEPALGQGVSSLTTFFGEAAGKEPFAFLARAVQPEEPKQGPIAIMVRSSMQDTVLKAIGEGKLPELKKEESGAESFVAKDGITIYVAKQGAVTLFGPDKVLVNAFAKGGGKSFVSKLSAADQKRLTSGDVSIAVNLDAITSRYQAVIDQAKQGLLGAIDQVPQQPAMASMMGSVKKMYGTMFDSIKQAGALTLSLDFAAEGLNVNCGLTVKNGESPAKSAAAIKSGTTMALGGLPIGGAYYVYMNLDAASYESLQKMGLNMMGANSQTSPELDALLAKQRAMGRVEAIGSTSMGGGMTALNVIKCSDPKTIRDSMALYFKAATSKDSPMNLFKDIKISPDAEAYKGYSFTRVEMVLDMEKLANMQPGVPGGGSTAAMMKAMYGGDRFTTWYGVNDTQLISITESGWDKAKGQIDAYLAGEKKISETPGFKAVQSKLSDKASLLVILSMQGLTKQLAAQFGGMMNKPDLKPSADMPTEPAYLGFSLNPVAGGYEFDLVIPSAVGAVIEKGIVPVFAGLRPNP